MQSLGLLLKVLWSPGEAMFLLSKKPRALVALGFISLCSLLSAIAIASKQKFGELYMNTLAKSPQAARMPEDAKAQMQRVMSLPAMQGVFIALFVVTPLIIVTLIALIYFGLFSMVGRDAGFKAFFAITAFAFVPGVFSGLAGAIRAFVSVPSSLLLDELYSLSPATFLDRDAVSPFVFAAANSIDLVTIWTLILLVIGYGFVTPKSVSKGTRTVAVVGVLLVYEAIKLVLVARS